MSAKLCRQAELFFLLLWIKIKTTLAMSEHFFSHSHNKVVASFFTLKTSAIVIDSVVL